MRAGSLFRTPDRFDAALAFDSTIQSSIEMETDVYGLVIHEDTTSLSLS